MTHEAALAELLRLGFNLFDAYNTLYEASKMGSFRTQLADVYYRRGMYSVESKTLAKR